MTEEVNINGQEQESQQEIREGQGREVVLRRVERCLRASARTHGPVLPTQPTPEQLEYLCKIEYYNRLYLENLRLNAVAEMLTRCDQLLMEVKRHRNRYCHPRQRHLT